MKTMMSLDGTILRVSDEKASQLFQNEGFRYVGKSMWKEKVSDLNKSSEEPIRTKANKMSKATKRHLRNQNKK